MSGGMGLIVRAVAHVPGGQRAQEIAVIPRSGD